LKFRVIAPVIVIALFSIASAARATDQQWVEAGARVGFSKTVRGEDFNQLEIATTWRLPWSWTLDSGWILDSRINASAGIQGCYWKAASRS